MHGIAPDAGSLAANGGLGADQYDPAHLMR